MINPLQFFKCMADDIRLKCVMLIHLEKELCVCELVEALNEVQPKISRHLALLRQHGILSDRRQGQWIYYRLHPDLPEWANTIVARTANADREFITDEIQRLSAMGDRPVRERSCC